jgi:16S rRNA (guanine527-N7)-methyltransferase
MEQLLRKGLEAMALVVNDVTVADLLAFLQLLEKWNRAYNLTAVRKLDEMVPRHLLDSLSVLPHLHGGRIIDVGTGGGLPGVPLALLCPDREFVLLDSNSKKTRFVNQVVIELGLKNVTVVHSRAGSYQPEKLFDTVISRAFSSLEEMLQHAGNLCSQDGLLLAMKGSYPEQELQQIPPAYAVKEVVAVQVPGLDAQRHLVLMTHTTEMEKA